MTYCPEGSKDYHKPITLNPGKVNDLCDRHQAEYVRKMVKEGHIPKRRKEIEEEYCLARWYEKTVERVLLLLHWCGQEIP